MECVDSFMHDMPLDTKQCFVDVSTSFESIFFPFALLIDVLKSILDSEISEYV